MNVMEYYGKANEELLDAETAALETLHYYSQNITTKERAAIGILLTNVRGIRDGYTSIMKALAILVG